MNAAYNDPHVPVLHVEVGEDLESVALTDSELEKADCVVIVTSHSAYEWQQVATKAKVVVDTRNALKQFDGPAKIVRL